MLISSDGRKSQDGDTDQVLVVFYDTFTDSIEDREIHYDKAVIVRGRSHLIGKTLVLGWQKTSDNPDHVWCYCEITTNHLTRLNKPKFWQYRLARVHVFHAEKIPLFITDYMIIHRLSKIEKWSYGEIELVTIPQTERVMR